MSATRSPTSSVRMLERELADVAVHDPHVATPTVSIAGGGSTAPRSSSWPPTTPSFATRARSRRLSSAPASDFSSSTLELLGGCPGVRLQLRSWSRLERVHEGSRAVSRVLVTGGAGTIGAAVVKRLLADPAYEVRVSDQRPAPRWMREGCEVHTGDLRVAREADSATEGCTHVIHLAAIVGGIANFHRLPYTLTEVNNALYNAVIRAAIDRRVERFVYVSSSMVFERAELFPTPEDYCLAARCPSPRTASRS